MEIESWEWNDCGEYKEDCAITLLVFAIASRCFSLRACQRLSSKGFDQLVRNDRSQQVRENLSALLKWRIM